MKARVKLQDYKHEVSLTPETGHQQSCVYFSVLCISKYEIDYLIHDISGTCTLVTNITFLHQ